MYSSLTIFDVLSTLIISLLRSGDLIEYLRIRFSNMSMFSSRDRKEISTITNKNMEMEELRKYLQECAFDEPIVNEYAWINPEGVVVCCSNPKTIGTDLPDRNFIRRVLNGELKVVSNLTIGKVTHSPSFFIARGIKINRELKGIVLARIEVNALGAVLPKKRLGKTSSFGLIDRSGMIVYKDGFYNIPIEKRSIKDDPPAWKALNGEVELLYNYKGLDGISRIAANVPVHDIGWSAFASTTTEEVLNKLNSQALSSVLIMLLIIIISVAVAMFFVLDLLRPIRLLQDAANAIACSDFSIRTDLQREDELGQTGMAFDKMAEHIQELEDSRMTFLQTAAHELRNPMTSVKGITSLIYRSQKDGKPLNNLEQLIEILNKEVSRLATLLNQILEAFSAERKNVQIRSNMEPINIKDVISSAVKMFEMDTTNNRVIVNNASTPIWVMGDYDRLEDVIRNLISNAVKYSPEMTEIYLDAFIKDEDAVLTVKDQGIGIPEEQLTKVFESFHRVSNVKERDPGGLGLGLYICKDIVIRHGGEIWAENNEDRGVTFFIKVPILKNQIEE